MNQDRFKVGAHWVNKDRHIVIEAKDPMWSIDDHFIVKNVDTDRCYSIRDDVLEAKYQFTAYSPPVTIEWLRDYVDSELSRIKSDGCFTDAQYYRNEGQELALEEMQHYLKEITDA